MKRILVSGGGTGGHIYPALAIARTVQQKYPGVEIAYIGTENGLESDIIAKETDIQFFTVDIQGLKRSITLENVHTVRKFIRAVRIAKSYIEKFKPDVVVGTGGYVSGPATFAAYQLGIPTLIHEQNAVLGITTKFLSRFASSVAVSIEESQKYLTHAKRVIYTGNPRSTTVIQADAENGRAILGINDGNKPIVLLSGGSRGADAINQAVIEMLANIAEVPHVQFVYITGNTYYKTICQQIKVEEYANLKIIPFIYNMPDVLAATTLVVTRAGASALAELTALGVPSILIPSPYATGNHQVANARVLEDKGAAKMILQQDCTGELLWQSISELLNSDEKRADMSKAAKRSCRTDAAYVLVDELERIIQYQSFQ